MIVSNPSAYAPGGAGPDPQLEKAAQALRENRPVVAEGILRRHVEANPADVTAMKMLADTLIRLERNEDAEELLVRCLSLAPDFAPARHTYVMVLLMREKKHEAFEQVAYLLEREPANPNHHSLKAMAHAWVGEHADAANEYAIILRDEPKIPGPWLALAHTLRTLGRRDEAVAAYRAAIARFPKLGEPYWSLANLKTFRFEPQEVEAMKALLAAPDLPVESRIQIEFALGRALETAGAYEEAFEHYKQGNARKRATIGYMAESTTTYVSNCRGLYTEKFLAERAGQGCTAPDPIFIVGMPRSGSTLIEQILSSHPSIEGTMELRIVPFLIGRIGSRNAERMRLSTDTQAPYPESVRNLEPEDMKALGEEYLARARAHRVTSRPFFIDKLPDNFGHVGLIHLILPNAKIIDARRDPMGCCVSNFKQYYPMGKDFSYSLTDVGRCYADYVNLMDHFDKVLPGRVHRVFYDRMVADLEGQTRRIFDYLGLPFDENCLRFHETERAVRTPSSEQVRMPIFKESLQDWKHFEPWLGPLKSALGDKLEGYARDLDQAK